MNDKHTPGPWMVHMKRDEAGTTGYYILNHSHTLVSVSPKDYWGEDYRPETDDDGYFLPDKNMDVMPHRLSTANLIAASPDLLEASERAAVRIEGIIEYMERHCSGENALSKRRIALEIQSELEEAIKKAKGVVNE